MQLFLLVLCREDEILFSPHHVSNFLASILSPGFVAMVLTQIPNPAPVVPLTVEAFSLKFGRSREAGALFSTGDTTRMQ